MRIEFVVSLLCCESSYPGNSGFPGSSFNQYLIKLDVLSLQLEEHLSPSDDLETRVPCSELASIGRVPLNLHSDWQYK